MGAAGLGCGRCGLGSGFCGYLFKELIHEVVHMDHFSSSSLSFAWEARKAGSVSSSMLQPRLRCGSWEGSHEGRPRSHNNTECLGGRGP